jgi:hypothetical protein
MEKSYKTNKHINKLIYYIKIPKKIKNELKQNIGSFAYLMWGILKNKPEYGC